MTTWKTIRAMHIWGIMWFFLCAGYLLVLALLQAGLSWTAIYTLSGHSIVMAGFLCLVYVYALYHGVGRKQSCEVEHPLTRNVFYLLLYVTTPFLGSIAGLVGCLGLFEEFSQLLVVTAISSLAATVALWIFIDPALGSLEPIAIPASRRQRAARLAAQKQQQDEAAQNRRKVLADALSIDRSNREQWTTALGDDAARLASILGSREVDYEQRKRQAMEIGLRAWRVGGVECMKELRRMVVEMCGKTNDEYADVDCLSYWWDGIGNWRVPGLDGLSLASCRTGRS